MFNALVRTVFASSFLLIPAIAQAQTATPPIADYSRMIPVVGTWSHSALPTGAVAYFRDSSGRIQLTVACQRQARRVTIARPAPGAAAFLSVWTTSLARNLPASFNPTTNQLTATVTATDPVLDAIAFSRGRVAIGISGSPALVVPAWPEAVRAVEECRI